MRKINIITDDNQKESLLVAVCDDEKEQLKEHKKILTAVGETSGLSIEYYHSPEDILDTIKRKKYEKQPLPEVVFCDIVMPQMNGIQLGKELRELLPDCYFIFITTHPEYAIQGYETRAFRYILKPLTMESVQNVIAEVRADQNKNRSRKLVVKFAEDEYMIDLKDIYYLSSEDKYTFIYTADKHFMDSGSLNEYEELLNQYGFCRIHRKYMVNMIHHKSIGKKTVTLDNDMELPFSRRREKEYREMLFHGLDGELIR